MNKIIRYVLLTVILGISSTVSAKSYHFASIVGLVDQEVGAVIMKAVYERVGYTLEVTPLPGLRAQSMANTGEVDGEVMRIWGYGDQTNNVIRVPTPFYSVVTMGYYKKEDPVVIHSKEDLNKYSILKVLGVKHTDQITREVNPNNITNVTDPIKMMRYLHEGKPQLALTNPLEGDIILKQLKYNNIIPLKKPLATQPLYHYIHKKNADLVSKIDDMLKQLKNSGELKVIVKQAEEKVIHQRLGSYILTHGKMLPKIMLSVGHHVDLQPLTFSI